MKMRALPLSGLLWTVFGLRYWGFPLRMPMWSARSYHGARSGFSRISGGNSLGAQHINQAAINFVMDPVFNTSLLAG